MVHMLGTVKGKAWKSVSAFYGPHRVVALISTNAEVRLVDKLKESTMFVAFERLCPCPVELKNDSWTRHNKKHTPRSRKAKSMPASSQTEQQRSYAGPTTRSRTRSQ